jgi:hypothetical protein
MYRVRSADGSLSGMVNLARAKDALASLQTTPEHVEQRRQDRGRLQELTVALDASERQLRRDECGDWQIGGRWGHIYAMGDAFHLVVFVDECDVDAEHRSATRWTYAKRRLSFATVDQDGDDEGILRLTRLPTPEEGEEMRSILGIRRRRHLSPEEAAQMVARLRKSRSFGEIIALEENPGLPGRVGGCDDFGG